MLIRVGLLGLQIAAVTVFMGVAILGVEFSRPWVDLAVLVSLLATLLLFIWHGLIDGGD